MSQSPKPNRLWRMNFDEKQNLRGFEGKQVGVFNQECLFFGFIHGGYHDHDHGNERFNTYMTGEKDMVMGPLRSQKLSVDLLQNCDLPPPLKVFIGPEKTLTSMKTTSPSKKLSEEEEEDKSSIAQGSIEDDKLGLMKALQLSQTRAREAERKARLVTQERDRLSDSFLEESLKLFAHRQWVKLLELEVSQLRSQKQQKHQLQSPGCGQSEIEKGSLEEEEEEERKDNGSLTWCMALALCLGITGVGIALGYRYLF